MRPILSLLLALCLAPLCNAETWRVWIDPGFYTAIQDSDDPYRFPLCLVRANAEWCIEDINRDIEPLSKWRLKVTRNRKQADIEIISQGVHQNRDLYSAAAQFDVRRNRAIIHSGWIDWQYQGKTYYWFAYVKTHEQLKRLLLHEIFHHRRLSGYDYNHHYDGAKLLNKKPGAKELALIRKVFGR